MGLLGSTFKQLPFLAEIRMSLNTKCIKKPTRSHSIYYELSGQVQHSFLKYSTLYFIVGKFSFG